MTDIERFSPLNLTAMLSSASVEVSSRGDQLKELRDHFAAGIDVTITFLPGDNYRRNVATASALRRLGFNPVLHVAAREMPSREALDDFLARARGEAEVDRVLLIAGDIARALGPFKSSAEVCASGVIEARGIRTVSFAGYPEGHTHLDLEQALTALAVKRDWGRRTGVHVDVISQFCFESAPIIDWLKELDARGLDIPVIVGLAGPATPANSFEVRFALRRWKFVAVAARTDRSLRPPPDRHRSGRRRARFVRVSEERRGADCRVSYLSVWRPRQDESMVTRPQPGIAMPE